MFYYSYAHAYFKLYRASHKAKKGNAPFNLTALAIHDLMLDQCLTIQLLLECDRFYIKLITHSKAVDFLHDIFITLSKQNPTYLCALIFDRRYVDILFRYAVGIEYLFNIAVSCEPLLMEIFNFNSPCAVRKQIYEKFFTAKEQVSHLQCIERLEKIMRQSKEITKQVFRQETVETKALSSRLLSHPDAWEILIKVTEHYGIKHLLLRATSNSTDFAQWNEGQKCNILSRILLQSHLEGSPNINRRPKTIMLYHQPIHPRTC